MRRASWARFEVLGLGLLVACGETGPVGGAGGASGSSDDSVAGTSATSTDASSTSEGPASSESTGPEAVFTCPALEHVGQLVVFEQWEMASLESLVELAERGVVFEGAYFGNNGFPVSEIDAFAAAASITPELCWHGEGTPDCEPCYAD